jgi:hypothetical protein
MTSTPKRRDNRRFRLATNDNETIVETPDLEAGNDDVEGHRRGPGGNIPNVDGSPDDFSNKRLFRDFDAGSGDDVEGHRLATNHSETIVRAGRRIDVAQREDKHPQVPQR